MEHSDRDLLRRCLVGGSPDDGMKAAGGLKVRAHVGWLSGLYLRQYPLLLTGL